MARIAINGLGRVGRAAFKQVMDYPNLELVAVNDLASPEELSYLLRHDSIYGRYGRHVSAGPGRLRVDEREIPVYSHSDPDRLPWGELGVDLVLECSGRFTYRVELEMHLRAGAGQVILSAPGRDGDLPTLVPGVCSLARGIPILCCAGASTQCVAPLLEVLERRLGIAKALMSSVHAYTASQALVDGPHAQPERGRAAGVNLVPTASGAARGATAAVPAVTGRFDAVAIRAPVAVGALVDLTLLARRTSSVEEVNAMFREEAAGERYRNVLGVASEPIVSSDIIGDARAAVVDLGRTQVVDGDLIRVLAWQDNEWGYAAQLVRAVVQQVGGCD